MLNYLVEKLKSGVLTFVNATINANRDMPYHDYQHVDEQTSGLSYIVGDNQIKSVGDQRKRFVSKSTLILCTEDTTLRFNSPNNVGITILASTWYEFKSNIYVVFLTAITDGKDLYLYFEGTLPQEARSPE
jgi:hypothetical protein